MLDSDPAPPRIGLLHCSACNKTLVCHPEDMLRHTRTGWPRCCHDVMALFTPATVAEFTSALTPPRGANGLPE